MKLLLPALALAFLLTACGGGEVPATQNMPYVPATEAA